MNHDLVYIIKLQAHLFTGAQVFCMRAQTNFVDQAM